MVGTNQVTQLMKKVLWDGQHDESGSVGEEEIKDHQSEQVSDAESYTSSASDDYGESTPGRVQGDWKTTGCMNAQRKPAWKTKTVYRVSPNPTT